MLQLHSPSVVTTAAMGKPFPIPFAMVTAMGINIAAGIKYRELVIVKLHGPKAVQWVNLFQSKFGILLLHLSELSQHPQTPIRQL
jgi:ureidoglycolate hydrolase